MLWGMDFSTMMFWQARRRLALVIAFFGLASSEGFAQTVDWSGFYAGGNVGYGWGRADGSVGNVEGSTPTTLIIGIPITYATFPNPVSMPGEAARSGLAGVIGGAQVGYNFQHRSWITGFEADFQGGARKAAFDTQGTVGSSACTEPSDGNCGVFSPIDYSATGSYQARIDWFGTLRGRIGGLLTDRLVVYGTAGLAYGRVGLSGKIGMSATGHEVVQNQDFDLLPGSSSFDAVRTRVGFALGAGIEGRISTSRWSWKAEYLHVDLGSLNASSPVATGVSSSAVFNGAFSGTSQARLRFTDDVVRIGLNYSFAP